MLLSVLDGVATGFLLFVFAIGLSLVLGMVDVLNLAHGALYLGGAYLGAAFAGGGWAGFLGALGLAAVGGLLAGAVLGLMTEPLRRRTHLDQALLTLGVALVVGELLAIAVGDHPVTVPAPPGLDGSVGVLGTGFPTYWLLVIGAGALLALLVYLVVQRTRVGALVRAGAADREMVAALGVDTRLVKVGVFAVGSLLATTAGVLGGPVYGSQPGLDATLLTLAVVVVVIGGPGSVRGTLVGALIVGQADALGRVLLPDLAAVVLFAALALVLLVRPRGLFGGPGTAGAR